MDEASAGEFRPPYMSFKTFWSFLDELLSRPLPPQIDRSLMNSKSGTDQVNLTAALKAFELIDSDQTVTGLRDLEGRNEDARVAWLALQLQSKYAAELAVSDANGTEQQLRESFKNSFKIDSNDTLRKSVTFFLHAAGKAGLTLSPHFPVTRPGSGSPGTPKVRRAPRRRVINDSKPASPPAPYLTGDTYSVQLASGGSVSVVVSVNLFSLTTADRNFVIDLVDKLKGYPQAEASDAEVDSP